MKTSCSLRQVQVMRSVLAIMDASHSKKKIRAQRVTSSRPVYVTVILCILRQVSTSETSIALSRVTNCRCQLDSQLLEIPISIASIIRHTRVSSERLRVGSFWCHQLGAQVIKTAFGNF